ncbi:MAG: SURF1 family cytochrome oxidase biogenesis protein [Erythrobacter sp.]
MSARTIPLIPTIIVAAAVATMIALGIWQLGRMAEKADLLARYDTAAGSSEAAEFPLSGTGAEVWFRQSEVECDAVAKLEAVAGTSARGQKGWVQRATCASGAIIDIGFTRELAVPDWQGGAVSGVIAPGPRLVADPPVAGLEAMARPDPSDLPNNHLAYAGQWFFFAVTALVIYVLALRRRRRVSDLS